MLCTKVFYKKLNQMKDVLYSNLAYFFTITKDGSTNITIDDAFDDILQYMTTTTRQCKVDICVGFCLFYFFSVFFLSYPFIIVHTLVILYRFCYYLHCFSKISFYSLHSNLKTILSLYHYTNKSLF